MPARTADPIRNRYYAGVSHVSDGCPTIKCASVIAAEVRDVVRLSIWQNDDFYGSVT